MSRKNVSAPHQKAAAEINRRHQFAKEMAEAAVDHAIECGKLLARVKGELPRGEFDGWVEKHCNFGRSSAYAYIKVADKSSSALENFTSIQRALGYEPKSKSSRPLDDSSNTPKGEVSVVKAPAPPEATEETGEDRPASPATPAVKATPEAAPDAAGVPARGGVLADDEPAYEPDDAEEDAALAAAEAELAASIDKVMRSDDRLAAAHAEIKRQAAEIAALKISRDGFMGGKAEMVELLKREQRKTAALQRKLDAANAEIDRLRERIAIQEGA